MTVDWAVFTPWRALAGGALIGLGAAMLVLVNGRIAGVSGIVGGLLRPAAGDLAWRVAFVGGLIAAAVIAALLGVFPVPDIAAGTAQLIVAGLLVGVGTSYCAGCTSGHGVCGLSRLSPRSAVATAAFMAAGFATVYASRHLLGR